MRFILITMTHQRRAIVLWLVLAVDWLFAGSDVVQERRWSTRFDHMRMSLYNQCDGSLDSIYAPCNFVRSTARHQSISQKHQSEAVQPVGNLNSHTILEESVGDLLLVSPSEALDLGATPCFVPLSSPIHLTQRSGKNIVSDVIAVNGYSLRDRERFFVTPDLSTMKEFDSRTGLHLMIHFLGTESGNYQTNLSIWTSVGDIGISIRAMASDNIYAITGSRQLKLMRGERAVYDATLYNPHVYDLSITEVFSNDKSITLKILDDFAGTEASEEWLKEQTQHHNISNETGTGLGALPGVKLRSISPRSQLTPPVCLWSIPNGVKTNPFQVIFRPEEAGDYRVDIFVRTNADYLIIPFFLSVHEMQVDLSLSEINLGLLHNDLPRSLQFEVGMGMWNVNAESIFLDTSATKLKMTGVLLQTTINKATGSLVSASQLWVYPELSGTYDEDVIIRSLAGQRVGSLRVVAEVILEPFTIIMPSSTALVANNETGKQNFSLNHFEAQNVLQFSVTVSGIESYWWKTVSFEKTVSIAPGNKLELSLAFNRIEGAALLNKCIATSLTLQTSVGPQKVFLFLLIQRGLEFSIGPDWRLSELEEGAIQQAWEREIRPSSQEESIEGQESEVLSITNWGINFTVVAVYGNVSTTRLKFESHNGCELVGYFPSYAFSPNRSQAVKCAPDGAAEKLIGIPPGQTLRIKQLSAQESVLTVATEEGCFSFSAVTHSARQGQVKLIVQPPKISFGKTFPGKIQTHGVSIANALNASLRLMSIDLFDDRLHFVVKSMELEPATSTEIGLLLLSPAYVAGCQDLSALADCMFNEKEYSLLQTLTSPGECVGRSDEKSYHVRMRMFKEMLAAGKHRISSSIAFVLESGESIHSEIEADLDMPNIVVSPTVVYPIAQVGDIAASFVQVTNPSDIPILVSLSGSGTVCPTNYYSQTDSVSGCDVSESTFCIPSNAYTRAVLEPDQTITLGPIHFRPFGAGVFNATLWVWNNLTGIAPILLVGQGGQGELQLFAGAKSWTIPPWTGSANNSIFAEAVASKKLHPINTDLTLQFTSGEDVRVLEKVAVLAMGNIGNARVLISHTHIDGQRTSDSISGINISPCTGNSLIKVPLKVEAGGAVCLRVKAIPDCTAISETQLLQIKTSMGLTIMPIAIRLSHKLVEKCLVGHFTNFTGYLSSARMPTLIILGCHLLFLLLHLTVVVKGLRKPKSAYLQHNTLLTFSNSHNATEKEVKKVFLSPEVMTREISFARVPKCADILPEPGAEQKISVKVLQQEEIWARGTSGPTSIITKSSAQIMSMSMQTQQPQTTQALCSDTKEIVKSDTCHSNENFFLYDMLEHEARKTTVPPGFETLQSDSPTPSYPLMLPKSKWDLETSIAGEWTNHGAISIDKGVFGPSFFLGPSFSFHPSVDGASLKHEQESLEGDDSETLIDLMQDRFHSYYSRSLLDDD